MAVTTEPLQSSLGSMQWTALGPTGSALGSAPRQEPSGPAPSSDLRQPRSSTRPSAAGHGTLLLWRNPVVFCGFLSRRRSGGHGRCLGITCLSPGEIPEPVDPAGSAQPRSCVHRAASPPRTRLGAGVIQPTNYKIKFGLATSTGESRGSC